MFLRMLDVEWRKLLKHPLVWVELAALVGILAAYSLIRYALLVSPAHRGPIEPRGLVLDLQDGLELFSFLSVVFYAGAAALIVSYDFPEGGVQAWLVRGVPRPLLVLARLVIVLLLGLLLVTVATFAVLGSATLARGIFLGSFSTGAFAWAGIPSAILRLFWGAVPYLAFTVLLAIVSRSPLFAAGGVVVYRTALESALLHVADRIPGLVRFIPAQLAFALDAHTYGLDQAAKALASRAQLLPEPQAAAVIAMLLVLCMAASMLVFSRQDWGG